MAFLEFDTPAADQTADILRSGIKGSLQQTKAAVEHAVSVVWQNPFGLTPQQVFDAMGTQGKTMVDIFVVMRAMYNDLAPKAHDIGALRPANKTLTFDAKGNGTVGDV